MSGPMVETKQIITLAAPLRGHQAAASPPHTSLTGHKNCTLEILSSFLIMFLPFMAIKVSFGYLFKIVPKCELPSSRKNII